MPMSMPMVALSPSQTAVVDPAGPLGFTRTVQLVGYDPPDTSRAEKVSRAPCAVLGVWVPFPAETDTDTAGSAAATKRSKGCSWHRVRGGGDLHAEGVDAELHEALRDVLLGQVPVAVLVEVSARGGRRGGRGGDRAGRVEFSGPFRNFPAHLLLVRFSREAREKAQNR